MKILETTEYPTRYAAFDNPGERLLPSWTRDELRAHLDQFINTLPLMPTE